ncbi:MAG: HigA family addiction module antitoxin [Candidatus Omnitrophota bacterium]
MEKKAYKPNIAIHPGETLEETLEALGMTQSELSDRTGLSRKTINEIVQKKSPITLETAIKFGAVFGMSPDFWNNLQRNYEETLMRLRNAEAIEGEVPLLKKFECYNELVFWKYVEKTTDPKEKVKNLLNFFGISSLKFVPTVQAIAFRQTKKKKISKESLAAWLRCGEIEASKQKTQDFDKEKLKNSINSLRTLTKKMPEEFSKKLIEICSSFGVAVAFVPYFKKTHVNGATKWITPNKALIQLSSKGKSDDIFWFSFFHEMGHLVKHGKKEQFVEFDYKKEGVYEEKEQEADDFASNTLIPKGNYVEFLKEKDFSIESIKAFAEKLDIASSIVAGRLSYDTGEWKRWSRLRKRLEFKREKT